MAIAQITTFLKAHCSIGVARYTWTMYPGHNLEYCLKKKRFEKYFNRSICTCRITGQTSEQDIKTWSLFALIIVLFFLSHSHRSTPADIDETGGQQDISLYEIQDSSVQGSTTIYQFARCCLRHRNSHRVLINASDDPAKRLFNFIPGFRPLIFSVPSQ